jgi:hypothetical protein
MTKWEYPPGYGPVRAKCTLMVTQRAKQIWATGLKEMFVVTPEGAGLVADEELAAKLGVPVLVMLPKVRWIIAKLE